MLGGFSIFCIRLRFQKNQLRSENEWNWLNNIHRAFCKSPINIQCFDVSLWTKFSNLNDCIFPNKFTSLKRFENVDCSPYNNVGTSILGYHSSCRLQSLHICHYYKMTCLKLSSNIGKIKRSTRSEVGSIRRLRSHRNVFTGHK